MGFLQEFREFAVKGNVVDMAVGVMVGTAFNRIVSSLVNDVVMPPIGWMLGGAEFKSLELVLKPPGVGPAGETLAGVSIRYGAFINNIIDFLIIALTMFVVVKAMNRVMRAREEILG